MGGSYPSSSWLDVHDSLPRRNRFRLWQTGNKSNLLQIQTIEMLCTRARAQAGVAMQHKSDSGMRQLPRK